MASCFTPRGAEDLQRWQRNEQDMESCKSQVRKIEVILQGHVERFAETGRRISKLESQVDLLNKDLRKMTVIGQSVAKLEGRLVTGEAEIAKVAKQQADAPLGDTQVHVETLETRLQGLELELLESVRHVSELVSRENSRALVFDSTLASRENSQLPAQADYGISGGDAKLMSKRDAEGDLFGGLKPKQNDTIPEGSPKLERDPLADLESKLQFLDASDMPGDRRDTPPKSEECKATGDKIVAVGGNDLAKDDMVVGQAAASPLPSSLIKKGISPKKQDSRVAPLQVTGSPLPSPDDEGMSPKHNLHLVAALQEQFPDHAHDRIYVDVLEEETILPLPPVKATNGNSTSTEPEKERTAVPDGEALETPHKDTTKKGWKFVPKWLRR